MILSLLGKIAVINQTVVLFIAQPEPSPWHRESFPFNHEWDIPNISEKVADFLDPLLNAQDYRLIDPLVRHLKQRVFAVNPGPGVHNLVLDWTQDAETLVYLPQQEKTRVRGDLGPLKIYHDGTVKFRPNCLVLLFTTPAHPITLNIG